MFKICVPFIVFLLGLSCVNTQFDNEIIFEEEDKIVENTIILPPVKSVTNKKHNINISQEDINSLALNVYFEARNQSNKGKLAVAFVTLNRVLDDRWPDTITKVVWQPRQFSWTNDGKSDIPRNRTVWEECKLIARLAIAQYRSGNYDNEFLDIYWYIADYIAHPVWTKELKLVHRVETHLFFTDV